MKTKRRILIVTGQLGLGGAERQLHYLVKYLDRNKYEVKVINLSSDNGDFWKKEIESLEIEVISLEEYKKTEKILQIAFEIRKYEPDVIYSHNFHVNGYAVLARIISRKRCNVIGGMRNIPLKSRLDELNWVYRNICLRLPNLIVCNSYAAEKIFNENYKYLPAIIVIPNGVNPIDFEYIEKLKKGSTQYFFSKNKIVVGFVGNLSDRKNPLFFIESLNRIISNSSLEIMGIMIGSGSLYHTIEENINDLGLGKKIKLLGRVPFAETVISKFDILCLPSKFEGMPNVVLEAYTMGVPVVASDVGDVKEIIVDGETGFVFSYSEPEKFEYHLIDLLKNPGKRRKMGKIGKDYVENKFPMSKMVEGFQEVFDTMSK